VNLSKGKVAKSSNVHRVYGKSGNTRKQLLPALMAVGGACGIIAAPASALELGELKVDSSLGQPLRASIAYALNPHEQLFAHCVYLRPGDVAGGLPAVSNANISIASGSILLAGNRAIREPLLTMQVAIQCPNTIQLSREYTLMIDPADPVAESAAPVEESHTEGPATATPVVEARASNPRPPVEARSTVDRSPISASSRYLVQRGDSLSVIASRIPNRSIKLWPAVDRIFAANPDAFIDGNRDRLKAGVWLDIPDLTVSASEPVAPHSAMTTDTASAGGNGDSTAYPGYEATAALETTEAADEIVLPLQTPVVAATEAPDIEEPSNSEHGTDPSAFDELLPGDLVAGDSSPFVSPIEPPLETDNRSTTIIPDTEIVEPKLVQPMTVVKTIKSDEIDGSSRSSWSWSIWLGGSGLALILGLLLFGQNLRRRLGSVAVAETSEPTLNRRRTDGDTLVTEAAADVDFEVAESTSQSTALSLDADLDDGAGLQDAADIDVAQDFGFSASATFDDELDIGAQEATILEDDSLPSDVIPLPEREDSSDFSADDLIAVPVEYDGTAETKEYTLTEEVGFKLLEQDYEDEMTATQSLNEEIARAALELGESMDSGTHVEIATRLPTNTLAQNDDVSDLDETALVEEATADMLSPDGDATVEMAGDDTESTVDMPGSDAEETVQMEVESGKVDTKRKKKAS
jgi:hypothetical protein